MNKIDKAKEKLSLYLEDTQIILNDYFEPQHDFYYKFTFQMIFCSHDTAIFLLKNFKKLVNELDCRYRFTICNGVDLYNDFGRAIQFREKTKDLNICPTLGLLLEYEDINEFHTINRFLNLIKLKFGSAMYLHMSKQMYFKPELDTVENSKKFLKFVDELVGVI